MSAKKEKGLPRCNGNSPMVETKAILPYEGKNVNPDFLRIVRTANGIQMKELVSIVKAVFPKYDKPLHSKCEHGREYGIQLRYEAYDAILEKYAPEQLAREKYRRGGCHKLPCRVGCRLSSAEYAELAKCIESEGFNTMQSWLAYQIHKYLTNKKEKTNND